MDLVVIDGNHGNHDVRDPWFRSLSPPPSIDSALIPCGGKSGRGGGERRGDMLEAINHVSIYFRRVARPVSWPSVSLRIRNCEMIVGLVADNLVARFSYGSLRLSRLARHPTAIWSMRFHPANLLLSNRDWISRISSFPGLVTPIRCVLFRGGGEICARQILSLERIKEKVIFGKKEREDNRWKRKDVSKTKSSLSVVIYLDVEFLWGQLFFENAFEKGLFFFLFLRRKLEKIMNKIHSVD